MGIGIFSPATAPTNTGSNGLGIFSPAPTSTPKSGRNSIGIFSPASARARPARKTKHRTAWVTVNRDGTITIQRPTGARGARHRR
jgi:hypothetical protein